MAEHELWSFSNALFFIILIILLIFIGIYSVSTIFNIKKIKDNWATERCNPTIMPFAGLFGYNTKENFEFCLGKIFSTHSSSYFGSISHIFADFSSLLTMVFDAISSIRNTIASLGGGINVIFQEFTERISTFFFRIRVSAIHIKTLIGRMYAILFSVMYMGLSGITGMTSFTNTFLFSFLDTFCFPGETLIQIQGKGKVQIKDIQIGDVIQSTNSKVTAKFRFYSRGQPMVRIGSVVVSTNHYLMYLGHPIKAGDHPEAIRLSDWNSDQPLYCLNTSDNRIEIDGLLFLDYDETSDGDRETMNYIEGRINSKFTEKNYSFKEYCPAMDETARIKTLNGVKLAKDIQIGDELVTGGKVIGLIRRVATELCELRDGLIVTPSTLYWNAIENKWERVGEELDIIKEERELVSFIVVPNSQIEFENGIRIRDYMELCSPDSEMYYSKHLESYKKE
jgi:hypothetical protein